MKVIHMLAAALVIFLLLYFIVAPLLVPLLAGEGYIEPAREFTYIWMIGFSLVSGVVIVLLLSIYIKLEDFEKNIAKLKVEQCGESEDSEGEDNPR